jgi:hypothetical protein
MLVPALALAAIAPLAAQTLNPIVTVLSRPTSTVPEECEQGLAPSPAPRIVPEEVRAAVPKPTPATAMVPPPTASLRGVLREIQDAAERGDRDGFHDALARAHGFVDGYPPGGEKKAANDVLKVYDDLQSIWDYLFQSPTGAFFDASTDNLSMMKGYPDYQRVIADQTIVDATGTRFYPTRETRDFLVREAAARLKRMGITAAAAKPAPATTTPAVVERAPKKVPVVEHPPIRREPASAVAGRSTKPKPHPTKVAYKATKPPAKVAAKAPKKSVAPPVKIAAKTAKPSVTRPTATKPTVAPPTSAARTPEVRGTPQTSVPRPPPPPTSTALLTTGTAAPPPPATTSTMPTTTSAQTTSGLPLSPLASSPLTSSTQTVATERPVQTTSTEPQPRAEPQPPAARGESRRSLILPLILIVVGVGVLILLFRTSS